MNMVPIGDLVRAVEKRDPSLDNRSPTFTYVDIGAVSQESKQIEEPQIVVCSEAPSRARQVVAMDDILVSTVRPNLNAVARVGGEFDGAIASTGFSVLGPDQSRLSPAYLYHWVRTEAFVKRMMMRATGQSYPAVSDKIVKASEIPLPSLAEQKRIAGILDQADALRRLRARALDKLNTLGQAIFHEMFGDPISNEMGWHSTTIGEAEITISDGNYAEKYPKASDFVDDGVPFIRANNVSSGTVIGDDLRYISVEKHELLQKGHLRTGDVLITTRGKIGNLAVVPIRFNNANINAQIVLLRCSHTAIQPNFLYYQLSQRSFQLRFEQIQTGVALKQLPVKRLKQLKIVLPPVDLQNDFTEKMQTILKQRETVENGSRSFSSLFASLQYRAFRDEL